MGKETGDYLILAEFLNSQKEPFYVTSLPDDGYNCVAWALGDTNAWYEPEEDYSLLGVIHFFEQQNFEVCANEEAENGYEKIALFSEDNQEFTHVAKHLENNLWTSKLGFSHDVSHTLGAMQSGIYGDTKTFMKRKLS